LIIFAENTVHFIGCRGARSRETIEFSKPIKNTQQVLRRIVAASAHLNS
jgi:hypothetical protein